MTFSLALDSSILISHLTGDVHQDAVLAAMEYLDVLHAEVTLPLLRAERGQACILCYTM